MMALLFSTLGMPISDDIQLAPASFLVVIPLLFQEGSFILHSIDMDRDGGRMRETLSHDSLLHSPRVHFEGVLTIVLGSAREVLGYDIYSGCPR